MPKAYLNRQALEKIQKDRLDLAEKKNNDYGGRGDNIEIGGVHGIAIRMLDKAMRLVSLTTPGAEQKVEDESIRQTFQDSGNYSDFGVSLLDGTWGVRPPEPIDLDGANATIAKQAGKAPDMMTLDGVTLPISVVRSFFRDMGEIKESFIHTHIPIEFETRILDAAKKQETSRSSKKKGKKVGGVIVPYPMSKKIIKDATEWGKEFEAMAHRGPPPGVSKTAAVKRSDPKKDRSWIANRGTIRKIQAAKKARR